MVTPRVSRQVAKAPSQILSKPAAVASAPLPKTQRGKAAPVKISKSLDFMAMAAAIRVIKAKTKAAADKLEAQLSEKANPVKATSPKLVRCGRCAAQVRPDSLKKHQQRCSKTTSLRTKATKGKSASHRQANSQSMGENLKPAYRGTTEEDRHSRNMDGGKHNYVIREFGRFGSSPSYDKFGDDSGPE